MLFKNIRSYFNLQRRDIVCLLAIFTFSFTVFASKLYLFKNIGFPFPDVIVYLFQSLYYAGINFHNVGSMGYAFNSPPVYFFTSLIFRLGFVSPYAIVCVTWIFEIIGNIGLYILLKKRFNSLLSFFGAILYCSLPIIVYYSSSGLLDIPAVAVSIWIFIFLMLAINKNHKFYLIAIPLTVFGVFTRPTTGLFVIPCVVLYFLYKHDAVRLIDCSISDRKEFKNHILDFIKSDEFKYLFASVVISIILTVLIIMLISSILNADFVYLQTAQESVGGLKGRYNDFSFNENFSFYLDLLPQFFLLDKFNIIDFNLANCMFIVVILSLLVKGIDLIGNKSYYGENKIRYYFKTPYFNFILKIFALVFAILGIFFIFRSYVISIGCMFISFVLILSLIKKYNPEDGDILGIILFAWMVFYLIFISFVSIKTDRYFIPCLIPIIYMIVYSFEYLIKLLSSGFDSFKNPKKHVNFTPNKIFTILIILCTFVLLINAAITVDDSIKSTNSTTFNNYSMNTYNGAYRDYENVANFLKDYDLDYLDKNITTDQIKRFHEWLLNKDTGDYINRHYEGIGEFDQCGSDYIILDKHHDFKNYTEIYHSGRCYLYEHI